MQHPKRFLILLAALVLPTGLSASLTGCSDNITPGAPVTRVQVNQSAITNAHHVWDSQPSHLKHAIDIKNKHVSDLLDVDGVIGAGVSEDNSGNAEIVVFTSKDGVHGIAGSIEGVKTRVENVGTVSALPAGNGHGNGGGGHTGGGSTSTNYKAEWRPLVCGVSTGRNNECAAGTIGCLVSIGDGHKYMLSNNHVFAAENNGHAGDPIDQPGRYDTQCGASWAVGTLTAFNTISDQDVNEFDAAIALVSSGLETGASAKMANGYNPVSVDANTAPEPAVGMAVTKVGRTSGVTTGTIGAIAVTIRVSYDIGTATFNNQIYVKGNFIRAGDSGSLMMAVDNGTYTPVGLDFAGGGGGSFASPIGPILSYFNATVIHDN